MEGVAARCSRQRMTQEAARAGRARHDEPRDRLEPRRQVDRRQLRQRVPFDLIGVEGVVALRHPHDARARGIGVAGGLGHAGGLRGKRATIAFRGIQLERLVEHDRRGLRTLLHLRAEVLPLLVRRPHAALVVARVSEAVERQDVDALIAFSRQRIRRSRVCHPRPRPRERRTGRLRRLEHFDDGVRDGLM